jgi:asparagine synthase (glutamine-hydrolysing)
MTMCGITGVLRLAGHHPHTPGLPDVQAMTAAMSHRGPHGDGTWHNRHVVLGHRRLAVVDLTPAGAQPMTRDHLTLVYNGEIYNAPGLRRELLHHYQFRSTSDTEVLLRAWQRWGPAALDRLDGMYAFAIWDNHARRLHLVRDRLGIKPLYYHHGNQFLAFASEIDALLTCPQVPRRSNIDAVYSQLLCSSTLQVDRQRTLVAAVTALPPAIHLTITADGNRTARTYWHLPVNPDPPRPGPGPAQAAAELHDLLQDSVTSMLTADVPVAALLSGGLDSAAITALAAATGPITAITAHPTGPDGSADLHHARLLTDRQPDRITHHITSPTPTITVEDIDAVIDLAALADDPRHLAIAANYRTAHQLGFRAVLNGQGADEIMAGYVGLPTFTNHILNIHAPDPATIGTLPASRQAARLTPAVLDHRRAAHQQILDLHARLPGTPLERAHRLLVHTQLARVCQFEDLLSMRTGVECRLPYLNHRLVEWCFTHPFDTHLDPAVRQGKALLRAALSHALPPPLLSRPKQVFPHPDRNQLHRTLLALTSAHHDDLRADPLITHVFALPTRHELGDLRPTTLWLLLSLWRWHQRLHQPAIDPQHAAGPTRSPYEGNQP